MTKRQIQEYLQDILDAVAAIEQFTTGIEFEAFSQNLEKVFAVSRAMVIISTPDGQMPAFLYKSAEGEQKPGVILLMEAFGLTPHIREVATRIANQYYVVLMPDLYYRELPNNKFEYSEVEQAMAGMCD